jgi:uncharacterized protein
VSASKPATGRRSRFLAVVLLVSTGVQIPLVLALGRLTGRPLPVMGFAAVLTAAFLSGLMGPRTVWGAPSRLRLYLALWPFFVWWTVALLFALTVPLALAIAAGLGASTNAALSGALGVAAVVSVFALRQRPKVRAHDIAIENLPEAFDGYRIAQISDLHCGPFASGDRVADWVAATNRIGADLIAVTGDLIASGTAFVPTVAAELGALRAPDGVYAAMGNHDYFTDGEVVPAALEEAGLTVLRNRGLSIRRGDAAIYVAGVDDTWTSRHDVDRALAERPAGTPSVLLAHDPALFPEAVSRGVDLTISGHTHGGQVALPMFARRFNLARLMTQFTNGIYRIGRSTLYVNRGLGTTGPPVRLGVAPEIAVLTLRRG